VALRVPCPICRTGKPWEGNPFRPFCSERCRMIDLGTWAGEGYRIAGDPVVTEDDQEPADD
jgi:endogenous inhibitor of DNA gyrase (YacG/DUF329 family)